MQMNDTLAGLVLLAAAAALISAAAGLPNLAGQPYGPGAFPLSVGLGLVLPAALILVSGMRREGWPRLTLSAWVFVPTKAFRFLLVFASVLFYVYAVRTIGFIPVVFVILFILTSVSGVRWLVAVIASASTTATAYLAFATLLGVPLPKGTLIPTLWGMIGG